MTAPPAAPPEPVASPAAPPVEAPAAPADLASALRLAFRETKLNPNVITYEPGVKHYFGTVFCADRKMETFLTMPAGAKAPTAKDLVASFIKETQEMLTPFPKTEDWYANHTRRGLERRVEHFAELLGAELFGALLRSIGAE